MVTLNRKSALDVTLNTESATEVTLRVESAAQVTVKVECRRGYDRGVMYVVMVKKNVTPQNGENRRKT